MSAKELSFYVLFQVQSKWLEVFYIYLINPSQNQMLQIYPDFNKVYLISLLYFCVVSQTGTQEIFFKLNLVVLKKTGVLLEGLGMRAASLQSHTGSVPASSERRRRPWR